MRACFTVEKVQDHGQKQSLFGFAFYNKVSGRMSRIRVVGHKWISTFNFAVILYCIVCLSMFTACHTCRENVTWSSNVASLQPFRS